MLFVIARDNECEELVEEKLVLCRDWFELLAKKSIGSKYVNAEWQFAKHLGDCEGCDPELIFSFIKSEYEYTSRMALWTMVELKPECAERYAFEFWDCGKQPGRKMERSAVQPGRANVSKVSVSILRERAIVEALSIRHMFSLMDG